MNSAIPQTEVERARTAALAVATLAFLLYVPTFWNGFIPSYDDNQYVTENAVVLSGLTWEGIVWAFTTDHFANWLPITWLSHMLDVTLFGDKPGGHHATSAALHALNAGLLLWWLFRISGQLGVSVVTAAIFALHPLRVESVAWIAERKDVLAGVFFLLALLAYLRYVERPSWKSYAVILLCHALGLMSKTMVVTLPAILLLLDWWPLQRVDNNLGWRIASRRWLSLAIEKLPLLALSGIAAAWTILLQRSGRSLEYGDQLTLVQRLANAIVAVPRYLYMQAVPVDLAVFYPHPGDWAVWKVIGSALLLVAISLIVWRARRRAPYLLFGWIWFLVMFAPVSGVIQAGMQSIADRYTYLPGIGLTLAVVWLVAAAGKRWNWSTRVGTVCAVGVCIVLSGLSVLQQSYWKDALTLFAHADAVTGNNWVARTQVGVQLAMRNDDEAAIQQFERAAAAVPRYANAPYNIGQVRRKQGRLQEAEAQFRLALLYDPYHFQARYALGATLLATGAPEKALAEFQEAVRLQPGWTVAQDGLVEALAACGRLREAAQFFSPDLSKSKQSAWLLAGVALQRGDHLPEAVDHLREAVRLEPASVEARYHLGQVLMAMNAHHEAATHLAEAVRLQPDDVNLRVTWAATLADIGNMDEAMRQLNEAQRQEPDNEFAQRILKELRSGSD